MSTIGYSYITAFLLCVSQTFLFESVISFYISALFCHIDSYVYAWCLRHIHFLLVVLVHLRFSFFGVLAKIVNVFTFIAWWWFFFTRSLLLASLLPPNGKSQNNTKNILAHFFPFRLFNIPVGPNVIYVHEWM